MQPCEAGRVVCGVCGVCVWCGVCVCACVRACMRVCAYVCIYREHSKLVELQTAAKASSKGKWQTADEGSKPVRDVTWNVDNLQQFVDKNHGKEIEGEPTLTVLVAVGSCNLSIVSHPGSRGGTHT